MIHHRLFLCFLCVLSARADVVLAPVFGDHAVLQCDKPVPVWGRAAAGEPITVAFRGQTAHTTADAGGHWRVDLKPLAASAAAGELTVTGKNTLTLRDVVVGEVWLASGQSNMEWPVNLARDAVNEMAAANFPLIRHLKVEHASGPKPADTVKTSGWQSASPQTVGGFTAVGYFFARELHRKLGVPVGIIHSSWGGTAIESWLSDDARQATSLAGTLDARWKQALSEWPPDRVARYPAAMAAWQKADAEAKASHTKNLLPWPQPPATDDSPALPGGPFNAMIAPLQPGAIRGILWYQGESNVEHSAEYAELFTRLIRSWRSGWGQPELPFYFVQLPNYADGAPDGIAWSKLREAQAKALALSETAMAVTIDVGEPENLHPTNKADVGRRLALIALAKTYGEAGAWSGPQFARAVREGAAMRVTFHSFTGLTARGGTVSALQLAGADRIFHSAEGKIEHDTLLVSSRAVANPVAVRYAWSNAPAANLFNAAGLPAAPFRSDDW